MLRYLDQVQYHHPQPGTLRILPKPQFEKLSYRTLHFLDMTEKPNISTACICIGLYICIQSFSFIHTTYMYMNPH